MKLQNPVHIVDHLSHTWNVIVCTPGPDEVKYFYIWIAMRGRQACVVYNWGSKRKRGPTSEAPARPVQSTSPLVRLVYDLNICRCWAAAGSYITFLEMRWTFITRPEGLGWALERYPGLGLRRSAQSRIVRQASKSNRMICREMVQEQRLTRASLIKRALVRRL